MADLVPASADALRDVLRHFGAGVTVITTTMPGGEPAGMTATAFTSVSVEPPIVLVCMSEASRTAAAVTEAGRFAVNILAADQAEVAKRFAQRADDKFAGLAWSPGPHGLPILDRTTATVVCEIRDVTPAGSHLVVLGDVLACRATDRDALIYLDGGYGGFTSAPNDGNRDES